MTRNKVNFGTKPVNASSHKKKKKRIYDFFGYTFWISVSGLILIGSVLFVVLFPEPKADDVKVNDPSWIKEINGHSTSFQAAYTEHFEGLKYGEAKEKIGKAGISQFFDHLTYCLCEEATPPNSYSVLNEYPHCYDSNSVFDSHSCLASWAIAPVTALNNALCHIFPKEIEAPKFSIQQLLSCFDTGINCTSGGFIDLAFGYISHNGLVSEDCFPFQDQDTPCNLCQDPQIFRPKTVCKVTTAEDVMKMIHSVGPVVVPLPIFDDFLVYSHGIYQHTPHSSLLFSSNSGSPRSPVIHAVKIMGWGEDDGVPYWIIENNWGKNWGNEGYAKINRNMIDYNNILGIIAIPLGSPPIDEKDSSSQNLVIDDLANDLLSASQIDEGEFDEDSGILPTNNYNNFDITQDDI